MSDMLGHHSTFSVFGVDVTDVTMDQALEMLGDQLAGSRECYTVYFVNTHTLNIASLEPDYVTTLRRASVVFGDGTGVRWAARVLHGKRIKDNVNGTDLTPLLFGRYAAKGYRYYLLGATQQVIEAAAAFCQTTFTGWELGGFHHGYLNDETSRAVIAEINEVAPHLLLVGMGNPIQERWLDRYRDDLKVPLAMAIGGLFNYWSGDLDRAPPWVRKLGSEWVHLLFHQPRRARRYLLGNPYFLLRLAWAKWGG